MRLARDYGLRWREYLGRVSSLEITEELAYERIAGPQGEAREDWRCAWLAYWICRAFGGAKRITPLMLLQDLQQTLREAANPENELIEDPDLVEKHRDQVIAELERQFPRPGKETKE